MVRLPRINTSTGFRKSLSLNVVSAATKTATSLRKHTGEVRLTRFLRKDKEMDVSQFLGGDLMSHKNLPVPYQVWHISDVKRRTFDNPAESGICVSFFELPGKDLKLNKTNLNRVVDLFNSIESDTWLHQPIAVYRVQTMYKSDTVLCVRLNDPQHRPPMSDGAVEQILNLDGTAYVPVAAAAPVAAVPVAPVAAPGQQAPVAASPWEAQ